MRKSLEYQSVATTEEERIIDDDGASSTRSSNMRRHNYSVGIISCLVIMIGLLSLSRTIFVSHAQFPTPDQDTPFSIQQPGNNMETQEPSSSSSSSLPVLIPTTTPDEEAQYYPTALLQDTLHQCQTNVTQKCFLFVLKDTGLGNVLLNMYAVGLFLKTRYGYTTMLVDEVMYEGYHRGTARVPVLSGYFTPKTFAVVDTRAQRELVAPLLPEQFVTLDEWDTYEGKERKRFRHIVKENPSGNNRAPLVVASRQMFHKAARFSADDMYTYLIESMCQDLQFNDGAWRDVQALRRNLYGNKLPANLQHNNDTGVSVAFHVRRTDKVATHEAAAVPAAAYVDTFLQHLRTDRQDVITCFLATDDVKVVHEEMKQALADRDVPCQLVSTPVDKQSGTDRYQDYGARVFLSEFSVLLEATYFVGTFSSNVGSLAAVLRACPGRYDPQQHYADSYSADIPEWNYF